MEIKENSKGKAVYATKSFRPWEVIHSENALVAICTPYFSEKLSSKADIDQKINKFVFTHRDEVKKYREAKHGVILGKLNDDRLLSMAQLNVSIPRNVLRSAAKTSGIPKEKIEKFAQIYRANNFGINGLFGDEIGTAMFYTASYFNHSCDPNAFGLVTYNKIIVYARREISPGEEISIPYKSIGVYLPDEKLSFKCQCGSCQKVERIPEEFIKELDNTPNFEGSIDFIFEKMIGVTNDHLLNAYLKILLECYYEIWCQGRDHRPDDLYQAIMSQKLSPYIVMMEGYLIALVMAHRKNLQEDFEKIKKYVKFFLSDQTVLEHVVICIRLTPNHYHRNLLDALKVI